MHDGSTERPEWQDLLVGAAASFAVNAGYMLVGPHDQRVLLMLFFTVVVGMGLLLGRRSGPYGMGAILGAAASVVVLLTIGMIADWNWT